MLAYTPVVLHVAKTDDAFDHSRRAPRGTATQNVTLTKNFRPQPAELPHMNSSILARASKVVPDQQLLINLVRLRVRQLSAGHRPLLATLPGMGLADIALSEVAEHKLTSAPVDVAPAAADGAIISFPAPAPNEKAA
jgi:DNA-directed RNA polymerase subunit omega